ncbi:MAG: hypothetical protein IPJ00_16190 [Saprospirales bacterium]|nr:hypothetical protein [Saprospirales bacterium]
MDPNTKIIHYDRNHRLFQQRRELLRWAKEHESLSELKSKVITWEVKETATILQIPVVYHVHYHIRSIVGIDENENPIYGNHHICEISIPPTYPLQPCKIYFITDVWHPNVKADGKFKGKSAATPPISGAAMTCSNWCCASERSSSTKITMPNIPLLSRKTPGWASGSPNSPNPREL